MGTALAIDRQINNYLDKLNDKQKRAVLTVVKTMADQQLAAETVDIPESHKQTVRQRVKKYTKHPSSLLDWDQAQKAIKLD
jgi:hypothetical protein